MSWYQIISLKCQRYLVVIQLHKFLLLILLFLSIGSAFQFHLSSNVFAREKSLELVDQGAGNGLSSQILLTEKEQAWLDRRHTVRVRVGNVPPYHMSSPEPHGISVDYLRLIGKRFGINFSFVSLPIGWQETLNDLIGERKWCDLLATIARTPEREREISFTKDYISSPWVIFNRTDSSFVSRMQDLNGKNVAVERGFIVLGLIKDEYPQIKIVSFDTSIDALRSVATGKSDAYVGNLTGASYLIQNNGLNNLKVAAPTPFGTHSQAMGVRKDWPELTSIINKALMAMSDAEKSEIRNRWLSIRYEYGVDMKRVWSWAAGLTTAFSLIFAVFFIWNRRLKIEIESRRRTEDVLRETKERFSMALDVGNAGIWEWYLKTDEVRLDARFHTMLGYTPGELPNTLREWLPYHHPEDIPVWMSKAEAYLRGDSPFYESEHRIRNKSGAWNWVFTRGRIVNLTR